ncbi:MAG TPA: ATP-binding protein [Victivallales bacterium]|nr:ATP-binding protein [Victivallales bacterium]
MQYGKRDLERKTIQSSYWILIGIFIAIILVNILSYYINVAIGEFQASSRNISDNIRAKTISANLLFLEILQGASDKDLNAVWKIIEQTQEEVRKINNQEIRDKINDALLAFKGAMIELNTALTDPSKKSSVENCESDYYKTYTNLNEAISIVEPHLKMIAQSKIDNMKLLYIVLSTIIISLLGFAGWQVRTFVSMISAMEESNSKQNRLLSTVINSMDTILVFVDNELKITIWNSSAEKYFGIPVNQAEGTNLFDTLPFLSKYATSCHKAIQLQKTEELRGNELSISDLERIVDIKIIPSVGEHGLLLAIDDVTEIEANKKRTENMQRLETVRNLMKNLIVDFNEIFTSLENTLKTIENSVELSTPEDALEMKNLMASVRNTSLKAQDKVKKLSSMTREKEFIPRKVDLNVILSRVTDICKDIYGENVLLNKTLYDAKAFTMADPELLETVFFNMLENSYHALTIMKEPGQVQGGIIEVSIEKIYPDRNYRQIHPQAVASSYWVINIADNGVGMDNSISSKIFDPFFTTKEKIGAAGVGLSVADEIIRKHRGFIELYSVPGQGTSFSIFIPEMV